MFFTFDEQYVCVETNHSHSSCLSVNTACFPLIHTSVYESRLLNIFVCFQFNCGVKYKQLCVCILKLLYVVIVYVEMDLLLCLSASALSSSVMAHDWIFPLPNIVKKSAPMALITAATQNTFLQPSRVC